MQFIGGSRERGPLSPIPPRPTPLTPAGGSADLKGILPHVDASSYSEINDALEADLTLFDAADAVTVELQPGDCTFHHCRTLHYAGGNATPLPRKGLITHFRPTKPDDDTGPRL